MAPVDLPYLWTYRRNGVTLAYYRRDGRTTRIRDATGNAVAPGDPAFLAAYSAIHAAAGPAKPPRPSGPSAGSLASLIDAYRGSPEWRQLAPATRTDYDKALKPLRAHRFGAGPVAELPRSAVFALRDEFATGADGVPTPRRANRIVAVLSILMAWAVNRGWRNDNPAARPGKLRTGPGYRQWTAEDVARFLSSPDVSEPLRRAAALGYYTGQRKQDCLAMSRSQRRWIADRDALRGGYWELAVTPEKTKRSGARLWIPEHPALTRILDAAPVGPTGHLLTRVDGEPWKEDRFNHAFAAAAARVGLPDGSSFHGLRKALTAGLVEAGATDAEAEAIVYHATPGMTRHSRAGADRKRLARSGMAKLAGKDEG